MIDLNRPFDDVKTFVNAYLINQKEKLQSNDESLQQIWQNIIDTILNEYKFTEIVNGKYNIKLRSENNYNRAIFRFDHILDDTKSLEIIIRSYFINTKNLTKEEIEENEQYDENEELDEISNITFYKYNPITDENEPHNDDGPAVVKIFGTFDTNVVYRRIYTRIYDGLVYEYRQNGMLHRMDGPAKINEEQIPKKFKIYKDWYLWNNKVTEWMKEMKWRNLNKKSRIIMATLVWK